MNKAPHNPPRAIGLAGATLINLNGVVGSGIFALPALLYASAGSIAPLAILAFAALYAALVAVFAKLSTLVEQSGGPQLYAELVFGKFTGFQIGWLQLAGNLVARAANFHVTVSYLAALFPFFADPAIRLATIIALIAAFTGLAIIGTRRSIEAIWIGTLLKLAPILFLCGAGLVMNGLPSTVSLPEFSEVEAIALLLAFAFSGGATSAIAAGETQNPRKTIARSMFANLVIVAVFYALVQFAYAAIDPAQPDLDAPLASAGAALFGTAGVALISVAAIFSTGTNQLSYFVVMPRLIFGMSQRGLLPSFLSYVSPRWQTPSRAIATYGLIVVLLAISGGFTVLAKFMVAIEQVVFITLIAALIVAWRRNIGNLRGSMGWGWAAIIVVAIGFVIWLTMQIPASAALSTLALIGAGTALYFALRSGHGEDIMLKTDDAR